MTATRTSRRELLAGGLLAVLPGAPLRAQAAGPELLLPDPESFSSYGHFYLDLLKLALRKTASGAEAPRFVFAPPNTPRERLRQMLQEGELDLLWSTTTPEREQQAIAVRFNLLKGTNELRFLLVRAADLPRLSRLRSLDELRGLRAGAGRYWSDTLILRANGFKVETSSKFELLFRMLAAGRFDFMPRTRGEIDDELRLYADQGFAELPGLALQYEQPLYFFVSRKRPELAQRLARGLAMAAADGSFDALFLREPGLKASLAELRGYRGLRLRLRPLQAG